MVGFLVFLHIVVSIFLMLIVIMQPGKGADLAGAFGGGGSQTAFGARGAATLLHKLTVGLFIMFIITSIVLAVFLGRPGSSVMAGETVPVGVEEGAATETAAPIDAGAEQNPLANPPATPDPNAEAADAAEGEGEVVTFGAEPVSTEEPVSEDN